MPEITETNDALSLATSYDPAIHRWPHLVHADQLRLPVVQHLFDVTDHMLGTLKHRDRVKMVPSTINMGQAIDTYPELRPLRSLASCVVLIYFLEASTRTETSFAIAAARLGALPISKQDVGPASESLTSRRKGESFKQTMEMYRQYHADALVLRSPNSADPYLAAHLFEQYRSGHWPDHDKRWGVVISAGGGGDQHPTQALLDLYSIRKVAGSIDNLSILFAGDIGRARAVNSLLIALAHCGRNITLKLAVPVIDGFRLEPPQPILDRLATAGINFELVTVIDRASFVDLAQSVDFGYWTRLQVERYGSDLDPAFAAQNAALVRLDEELMRAAPRLHAFHPLPYSEEVTVGMEAHPRAIFNAQAGYGPVVRMALLHECILRPHILKELDTVEPIAPSLTP